VLIAVRSIQINTNPPDTLFDPEALRREPLMHFAFLGTSGSIPSAVRDTTSIVFVVPAGPS